MIDRGQVDFLDGWMDLSIWAITRTATGYEAPGSKLAAPSQPSIQPPTPAEPRTYADETCNGLVVRVDADELARLDWRERDYERTDVTDRIDLPAGVVASRVYTYLPRPSAIACL